MNKNFRKFLKNILLPAFIVFAVLALSAYYLLTYPLTGLKKAVLSTIPLPMAIVGGHPIYSTDYMQRLNDYASLKSAGVNFKDALTDEAMQSLVEEARLTQLAIEKKAKLKPYSDFVDLSPEALQKSPLLKRAARFEAEKSAFKFWYYSQKDLNTQAWERAEKILTEAKNGTDFGILAKTYSDDKQSLVLEGDLGPQILDDMLFELHEPLNSIKPGETAIIPSRLGLHVIQVYKKSNSENGKDVLYLKQIYIQGSDFESWVNKETKNYKVSKLLAI